MLQALMEQNRLLMKALSEKVAKDPRDLNMPNLPFERVNREREAARIRKERSPTPDRYRRSPSYEKRYGSSPAKVMRETSRAENAAREMPRGFPPPPKLARRELSPPSPVFEPLDEYSPTPAARSRSPRWRDSRSPPPRRFGNENSWKRDRDYTG